MKESEYMQSLLEFKKAIEQLPTTEVKYHLFLLLAILSNNNQNNERTRAILEAALDFTEKTDTFFKGTDAPEIALADLIYSYKELVMQAKTRHFSVRLSQCILHIGGGLCAIITGLAGAIVGGIAGLGRSLFQLENPFSHLKSGLIMGFCLGAAFSFRFPKKLFKNALTRQLKFCLDAMGECLNQMQNSESSLSDYESDITIKIREAIFNDDLDAFNEFLESDVVYTLAAHKAQFISPTLKGFVGNHAYIKIKINNQEQALEFSLGPSDLSTKPDYMESRIVKGEKIIEMMAFHQKLMETHRCDMWYILTKMKSGEVDCLSYVNKLLIGSGQEPSNLKRFEGQNCIGKGIGFFVTNLSALPQEILNAPCQLGLQD